MEDGNGQKGEKESIILARTDRQYDCLQVAMSEKQRDDALGTIKVLNDTVEKMKISSYKADELRGMPIQKLKTLQVKFHLSRILCDAYWHSWF